MKKSSGFTLIELLVVIAIIGILASIVLASLNTARAKGSDAAVKSAMGQLRSQAEMYYDSNSTYGTDTSCTAGLFASSTSIIANIDANDNGGTNSVVCSANGNAWAASTDLRSGTFWCVDSTGRSQERSTNITAGTDYSC